MKTSQLVKFVRALTLATTVAYAFAAFPATQEINVEANDSQELSSFTSNDIRKTGYGTLVTTGDFSGKFAIGQGVWRIAGGSSVECKQPTNEKENTWYYIYGDNGSDSDPSTKSRIEVTEGSTLYYNLGTGYQYLGLGSRNSYRGYGELVVTDDSTLTVKAETRIMDSGANYGVGVLAITNSTASFLKLRMAPGGGNVAGKAYFSACNSDVTVQEINCGTKSTISMDFDGVTLTPTKAHTTWITGRDANECLAHIGAGGLTINAIYDVTIGDTFPMDGVGGLVKAGAGALTMAASNLYTGDTELQEGVLSLNGIAGGLTVKGGSATVNGAVGGTVTATAGTISVGEGVSMAGLQGVAGTVNVTGTGVTIGTLGDFGGKLIIPAGAVTINALAEGTEITGTIECPDANVGDVVLTSASEAVRAAVKANFAARRITLAENEDALTLAPSDFVFDSTEISDLSDPNGWRNGELPPEGASVKIAGNGVKAEITQDSFVRMGVIELADGASLTIKANNTQGKISLGEGTSLVIASDRTLTLDTGIGFVDNLESAAGMASILVNAGATLKIPGGTKFKNVALTLNGSLVGLSDGQFVFGTANAGETAYFAMTTDGATITALNVLQKENAARIDFVVPAEGGAVVVPEPIVLTNTKFTYNEKDGFAFGLNNPSDIDVQIIADNTQLEVGANTYVAGGVNLVLKNGTVLNRNRNGGGATFNTDDASTYNLYINNRGRITVDDGGELRSWITMGENDKTKGAITFAPDDPDYVGLEVLTGGVGYWWKCNRTGSSGNIRFTGGVFELYQTQWWGWGNRGCFFEGLHSLEIAEGTTMTIKGVNTAKYSGANDTTMSNMLLSSPITGGGNLEVVNYRTGSVLHIGISSSDNTCTGTLKVLEGDSAAKIHFADKATWPGTVVCDGNVDLIATDDDHKNAAVSPTEVTFGAVELDSDFTLRLWGKDGLKNDQINITGEGWSGEGTLQFVIQDGYEPQPTNRWLIGTAPKGVTLPSVAGKWELMTEDADDTLCNVYLQQVVTEFNFIGGGEAGNILDADNWECKYVPVGKAVTIKGASVQIDNAETFPEFSSVSLREGASLKILASDETVTIPSLSLDATSSVMIGDGQIASTLYLKASVESFAMVNDDAVVLPKVTVASGATLEVPGGSNFANIDLEIRGTLAAVGVGDLTIGTAAAGSVSYLGLNVDCGIISTTSGDIRLCCADEGGTIVPVGDELRFAGATLARDAEHGISFGLNTPNETSLPFVFDATDIPVGFLGTHVIAGGSVITLKNGSRFYKGDEKGDDQGRATGPTSFLVQGNARVVVGEGCDLYYGAGSEYGSWGHGASPLAFNSETDVAALSVVGATFDAHRASGNGNAILSVADATNLISYCTWNRATFLNAFKRVDVTAGDLTLYLPTNAVNNGDAGTLYTNFSITKPICGEGGFVYRNDSRYPSTCIINSSENTAAGRIVAEGDSPAKLIFADGANWAGTVVWNENVSITNLEDGAAATSVTFGNLKLASGEFPIRVFKDAKGVLTCDQVNLTGAVVREASDTGIIRLTGVEPEIGDKISLGTAPAGAWAKAVVKTASGHTVQVIESEPDEHGLVTATLAVPTGFLIIIR